MQNPRTLAQLASITAYAGRPEATEMFLGQAFEAGVQQAQLQSLATGVEESYSQPIKYSADHSQQVTTYTNKFPQGDKQQALSYKHAVDKVTAATYKPHGKTYT